MEVEEVQRRCPSVVHRSGQNMSAAQTTATFPGSITSFLYRLAQTTPVPPGAEAFTARPIDIPATASAAAARTTVPVPADVPATAPHRYPYSVPPGWVNNRLSQMTTHFITGGTACTTPPQYTTPDDKNPKPKMLSPRVCYTLSYTVGTLLNTPLNCFTVWRPNPPRLPPTTSVRKTPTQPFETCASDDGVRHWPGRRL